MHEPVGSRFFVVSISIERLRERHVTIRSQEDAQVPIAAAIILELAVLSSAAQDTASPLSFDVASVKQNNSGSGSSRIQDNIPGRLTITNVPVRFILLRAFELMDHQLVGAPEWTSTTPFDITATYAPVDEALAEHRGNLMLQRLLADRFGLVVHREARELPMYALVQARKDGALGRQLTPSTVDCEKWRAEKRPQEGAGGPSPVAPGGKRPACMMLTTRRFLTGGTQTMQRLSASLQSLVGRPVVDRTGLAGTFDIDLQWTSGTDAPALTGNTPNADVGPSIFTALQEQLGLKLEATRGPFDVVVIDRVQLPMPD